MRTFFVLALCIFLLNLVPPTLALTEEAELRPDAGTVFKDCGDCPSMIVVPAGSFTMGSLASEVGRNKDEEPQREVMLAKPFAVGRFEITFDEWGACVGDGGCGGYEPVDQGWGRGQRPVINVNWNHVQSYIRWLRRKSGQPYRLLSEAEWEYVARAGSTTVFWWGREASHDYANYGKDGCCGGHVAGRDKWEKTGPIGQFPANKFGLFDLHGNVAEWTEDCGHRSYELAPTDGSAWLNEGGGNCQYRILRGGSWGIEPKYLRSASRGGSFLRIKNRNYGFRVAKDLD